MRNRNWQFWALLAVIVAGGALVNAWARIGEAHVERRALGEFPAELGSWRQTGPDVRFDTATEEVLGASDYLSRDYQLPDGRVSNFYVGYYASQGNGASYHSPLNCLPGSGWSMSDAAHVSITPAGGGPAFEANRYVIENGNAKSLLLYWYQGRGRAVASEYWGKIYTVVDSATRRRSDGALVRVVVPVRGSEEDEALRLAVELAAQAAPQLPPFVPN
jgi:EpsI family protein